MTSQGAEAAPRPRVSNLTARILTAVLLGPVIVVIILWRRPIGLFLLVLVAAAIALHEYFSMMQADRVGRAIGVALGLIHVTLLYALSPGAGDAAAAATLLIVFTVFLLRGTDDLGAALAGAARTSFGILYAGLLAYVALLKRDRGPSGGGWVILLLTVVWLGDTFAYAAGRLFGRYKLYPAVSPSKTWEGAAGGVVGSFAAAALARAWYLPDLRWADAALIAVPASLLGQIGDLCESMLKRACGVKDSGAVLPGHGGLLDRVDALLFAAPYVYFYALSLP